jgi:hypothetical protein
MEGEYECSVPEVVRRYVGNSDTDGDEAALMDAVEDELAESIRTRSRCDFCIHVVSSRPKSPAD